VPNQTPPTAVHETRDSEWVKRVIETHHERLLLQCLRLTRNPDAALDLAQEVVQRALANIHQLENNPRGWLHTIAIHTWINEQRHWGRRMLPGPANSDVVASEAKSPEQIYMEKQSRKHLLRLVNGLPDSQRLAIKLRFLDDMAPREIVERLLWSIGKVNREIEYALRNLRRRMAEEKEEHGRHVL